MQFSHTLDDEPRLAYYGLGSHVITQGWALVSQLVLPLTLPRPAEVVLMTVPPLQWGAGLAAIAAGVLLFFLGSMRLRFLLLWTAASLAPFVLWGVIYTSPRYVYMAAVPYSIIVAWLSLELFAYLRATLATALASRRLAFPVITIATRASIACLVLFVGVLSVPALTERNAVWTREAEKWGILTRELPRDVPDPAPGSRFVLMYGDWTEAWARATIQTIYGDQSLRVRVIPTHQVASADGLGGDDIILFRVGEHLLPQRDSVLRR
jgi:hypothetical protein